MAGAQLDPTDAKLLDLVQREWPLVADPFARLGDRLGLDATDVLGRLARLRDDAQIIRQISAIFDSKALGYQGTLVAAAYRPEQLTAAAEIINRHPGVTHNYQRDGRFNLWFTLSVPTTTRLGVKRTIRLLTAMTDAETMLHLPALRVFKIGVRLDIAKHDDALRLDDTPHREPSLASLDPADIPIVRALQDDLPLTPDPYAHAAAAANMTVAELVVAAHRLLESGVMRRYGAILNHHQAGYTANVLTAWTVPNARIESVGRALAGFAAVSHCYHRPAYPPHWPYNLLAMAHCRNRNHADQLIAAMVDATSLAPPAQLWSITQYKKVRLRYFTPDIDVWEAAHP